MEIVSRVAACRDACRRLRAAGERRLALVPTMGALHVGHLSLIRRAREAAGRVAVSIFVNPLQFGPGEDFATYPRPVGEDDEICRRAGVDLLFRPEAEEMYPPDFSTAVVVDRVTEGLCGRHRPGHFRGVATVVAKLFHIVQPDVAVFGAKDAQQAVVVGRMVRDLDFPVEIVVAPTVRESDGLALSSRNRGLAPADRRAAAVVHRALRRAEAVVRAGERDAAAVEAAVRGALREEPRAREEYVAVVGAEDLMPLPTLRGPTLVALAVRIGETRLIDNLTLTVEE